MRLHPMNTNESLTESRAGSIGLAGAWPKLGIPDMHSNTRQRTPMGNRSIYLILIKRPRRETTTGGRDDGAASHDTTEGHVTALQRRVLRSLWDCRGSRGGKGNSGSGSEARAGCFA